MKKVILTSERLVLREMYRDDADHLLSMFQDPDVMTYYPGLKNKEETEKWITWTRENYGKYGVGMWVVEEKGTGLFLGQCGIVLQKVEDAMEMEIGYMFLKQHWGKGYASEAARACKKYGFQTMNVPKLISLIDPANERSVSVATRIGMKREKRITKWERELDVYACYRAV